MRTEKAVTLIELLIVVLILAALSAIAIPRIAKSAGNAKANVCMTNVDVLNTQIELYIAREEVSSPVLSDVTGDADYFPDGPLTCPFGDAYVMNGATYRVRAHSH
jgi:prepilin-type N-terminal cleavage/methylation domain-containing protein